MIEKASELTAIDRVTESLYASICFGKGGSPDLEQLRRLFIPESLLINNNDDNPVIMSVDQFIEAMDLQVSNGSLVALHETELSGRTELFGKIAHRLSCYEARLDPDTQDVSRGVNSIQFVKTNGVWRLSALVWADESADNPIPSSLVNT